MLWVVVVATFPMCNVDLHRVERYVGSAYEASTWSPPPGQTELPYRRPKGSLRNPDGEWMRDCKRMRPPVHPFPATDVSVAGLCDLQRGRNVAILRKEEHRASKERVNPL